MSFEELEAVEIEDDRGVLNTGSGPEHCAARPGENPNWLYSHGINALALWWRMKQDAEREERALARRPAPGVYQAKSTKYFTVIVPEDRRVLVQMSSGGLRDATQEWDFMTEEDGTPWTLARIDTANGIIANG